MTRIKTFIDTNRDSILEELFELIRIPSISAKPENKPDMIRAAEFLRDSLKKAGADRADVFPTAGNPICRFGILSWARSTATRRQECCTV